MGATATKRVSPMTSLRRRRRARRANRVARRRAATRAKRRTRGGVGSSRRRFVFLVRRVRRRSRRRFFFRLDGDARLREGGVERPRHSLVSGEARHFLAKRSCIRGARLARRRLVRLGGYGAVASVPHTRSADASTRRRRARREFELERRRVGDFPTREIAQVPSPRRPEIGRRDGDGNGGFRGIVRGETRGGRDHLVQRGHERGGPIGEIDLVRVVDDARSRSRSRSRSLRLRLRLGSIRRRRRRGRRRGARRSCTRQDHACRTRRRLGVPPRATPSQKLCSFPPVLSAARGTDGARRTRGPRRDLRRPRRVSRAFARVTRASREASPDAAKSRRAREIATIRVGVRARGRGASRERERRRGRRRAGRCTRERSGSRRERSGSRRERLGSRRERLGSRRQASPPCVVRSGEQVRRPRIDNAPRATLACAARRFRRGGASARHDSRRRWRDDARGGMPTGARARTRGGDGDAEVRRARLARGRAR